MSSLSRVFRIIIFFSILLITSAIIGDIIIPKRTKLPWNVTSKVNGFYELPNNSLDIVFIGSSHSYCTFNPFVFYKKLNAKSYAFGANEQPIWISYHYLKEVLKYQKPKIIVLESLYISESREFQREAVNRVNLDNIPFSKNKIEMISVSEDEDFKNAFALYRYHDRWKNLQYDDFQKHEYGKLMGFTPLFEEENKEYVPNWSAVVNSKPLPAKNVEYLKKIIDLCKANNIHLILTYAPYQARPHRLADIISLNKIAKNNSVDFVNFLSDSILHEMDFNFAKDMSGGHTNLRGAKKVSSYLAKYILGKFSFNSNREFKEYIEFEEKFDLYDTLPKIQRFKDYVTYLKDKDVYVFIAAKDEASVNLKDQLSILGSKINWDDKYRWSYIGIFKPKNNLIEEYSDSTKLTLNKPSNENQSYSLSIESAGKYSGNIANIFINEKNHAISGRGLSMVIYDEEFNNVIDSLWFDTHGKQNPIRNKIDN